MFQTPEKKVAVATELLKDNVSTPDKFLRACHDAGITHGNRDTEDELWEFEEHVLRKVPGAIHAFRDSLIYELRQDTPTFGYLNILDRLTRSGNYRTSKTLKLLTMVLLSRNEKQVCEQISRASERFSLYTSEYKNAALHAKICGDRFRLQLAHAAALHYMCDDLRLDGLRRSRMIASNAETFGSVAFEYQYRRYLNTQIGLFGLDRHLTETPRCGQWLYRYRIGTWAAVAEWIVANTYYNDLGKFWDKSLADTRVITTTGRSFLPESSVFINDNKADWEYVGRLVPGFYRQYNEARAKLAKYR